MSHVKLSIILRSLDSIQSEEIRTSWGRKRSCFIESWYQLGMEGSSAVLVRMGSKSMVLTAKELVPIIADVVTQQHYYVCCEYGLRSRMEP